MAFANKDDLLVNRRNASQVFNFEPFEKRLRDVASIFFRKFNITFESSPNFLNSMSELKFFYFSNVKVEALHLEFPVLPTTMELSRWLWTPANWTWSSKSGPGVVAVVLAPRPPSRPSTRGHFGNKRVTGQAKILVTLLQNTPPSRGQNGKYSRTKHRPIKNTRSSNFDNPSSNDNSKRVHLLTVESSSERFKSPDCWRRV